MNNQPPGEMLSEALARIVIMGDYIPAHDETAALAAEIAVSLEKFRAHIARERTVKQAGAALEELAHAINSVCYDIRVASRNADYIKETAPEQEPAEDIQDKNPMRSPYWGKGEY